MGIIYNPQYGARYGANYQPGSEFAGAADGPQGWAVPSSAAGFTALGIPPPTSLWLCQEASGNLADSIGANTLTAFGTVGYQASVTGWTRKAVTIAPAGANGFRRTAGQQPNPATEDSLWIWYIQLTEAVGNLREILNGTDSAAGTEVQWRHNAGGKASIKVQAAIATEPSFVVQNDGLVHPYAMLFDNTSTRAGHYHDLGKIAGTYAVVVDGNKGLGGGVNLAAGMSVLWGALWVGADARLTDTQIKARMNALRISVGWS